MLFVLKKSLKQGSPIPLLGTGLHSRRGAVGKQAKLHLLPPIAPLSSHYFLNHQRPTPSPPVRGKIVFHETSPW